MRFLLWLLLYFHKIVCTFVVLHDRVKGDFFEYVLKLSWWQSWKYLVVNFSNITFPFFVVKQNAELSTSRRAFSSTNFHHGSIFGHIFSPETSQFKDFFIKKCVFFFESLLYIDRSINQSICFYYSNFRMLLMIEISLSLSIHSGLEYDFLQFWLLSIIKWMCFCISFSNSVKIYIEALEVIIRQIMCW